MRVKEMHPLCCISLENFSGGIGDQSPEEASSLSRSRSLPVSFPAFSNANTQQISRSVDRVAGVLYKWTNYGKGWRSRWFVLRDGVLSYSKISLLSQPNDDVQLIGKISTNRLSRRKRQKSGGIVHLKVSSFRESKSDDRRFYIFTATKTLHLRTESKKDRVIWIQALASSRSLFPLRILNDNLPFVPNDLSVSTQKLEKRLLEEGISDAVVKDCEQIILSEFSEMQGQLKVLLEQRSSLIDTLREFEAANIEIEANGIHNGEYQLMKHEFSTECSGKYSECATTESSDDVEKQDLDDGSDVDESFFYDTNESFTEVTLGRGSVKGASDSSDTLKVRDSRQDNAEKMHDEQIENFVHSNVQRRKKLPDPVEKEKRVSLWSMIKDNVGKDLARVCLPVYFNEPISSLQKCCEDMEYSHLVDQAYEHGIQGNNLLRVLKVAAFAVSGYASSEGRHCKPFNPLLGETYEADFPEKGIRFFSEKVSHHPTVIACHCVGRGWKFWGESNLRSKFWGRSIQLDPVGVLNLEFDDGERFQWSKVTTNIYNLILGKVYCDHHGTMHIRGNREYSCTLKFKEPSILDRNPHQVHGFVEDGNGRKVATLFGKWDEGMYYVEGESNGNPNRSSSSDVSMLWKSEKPPPNLTRYNLTSFAITLNELTADLKERLPPTDSRLRPDQRHLENGEYEKANAEKQRLERRQRISRKLQDNGWKPRWFHREGEDTDEPYKYMGGYWEARKERKWDGCLDVFGELSENLVGESGS
ncbi:oxysterol-binding protein-related protein 2A-like isoform X1 [Cucurbita pepo subsp. pepo]|uniref:oxysterol-binding protein-related protein 2A-like isoform X1 n=1 Tax=Cucurbita pepo subsp. pepo TaxID=3664 RepID=UPI000C9D4E47|nr:oxysterol-binding protein-related protein 2A-like isoform X1 [Cucurbita pepo subsp. pepo]XP_023539849.1 oxysterol-binding protein-related protein 2A-like isoform X1 [Cucurbita pepo subsp. pepo]